ncbi:MAG: hypothetical protein SGBAC_011581 [Bacillariaceae sp.]
MIEDDVRVFVEEAGNAISLSTEKQEEIIKRLEEEGISKKLQLISISNERWCSLGAPNGFVMILQGCLDRHTERELEELKETINSDVSQVMAAARPYTKRRGGSRKLSKANSMSALDLDAIKSEEINPVALALRRRNSLRPQRKSSSSDGDLDLDDKKSNSSALASPGRRQRNKSGDKRRISKSPEKRRAIIGRGDSDEELAISGQRRRSLGPRQRSSRSIESLNGANRRVSKSPAKHRAMIGKGDRDKEATIAGQRKRRSLGPRQRSSGSIEFLNDVDRRVSKSPEPRRAVIGHDVSDKELKKHGQRRNSLGPLRRKSKSIEPLNDVNRRVSKSPEPRRAVIGHDVSDKELEKQGQRSSSLGPRRRKSKSIEPLNDVNSRVSKSPDSRRAVIGHDISDKELEQKGQRIRSLGPHRRKPKYIEPLNDEGSADDKTGRRRRKSKGEESLNDFEDSNRQGRGSTGPRGRLSKSAESLRNLGDFDTGKKDSNPMSPASLGRRRRHSVGSPRFSKSPEKSRAVIDHNTSYSELDAVERSRLHRQQSRLRLLKKTASTSCIIRLKREDENIDSNPLRSNEGTSDDESSVSSRRRKSKEPNDEETSINSGRRRRMRGTSSNRSPSRLSRQRSLVLAPPQQSPRGLAQSAPLTDNDSTMRSRRRNRTKRTPSVGRLCTDSQSPRRSFARCQSASPSAMRALLSELDLSAALPTAPPAAPPVRTDQSPVHHGDSAPSSGPAQFQPSLDHAFQSSTHPSLDRPIQINIEPALDHAIQSSNRSYVFSDQSSVQSSRSLEPLSSVKKDAESGRFCFMSRGKIMYEWNQSFDTMVLLVPKPPEVPEADVSCTIEESSLQLGRKGDERVFFHRPLGGKCVPEKSIWVPYGGADVKGVMVHLKKANPGEKWQRPLLAVTGTAVKKTRKLDRRDSLPEDFGSPRLHKHRVGDAAHRRRRRLSVGQGGSSSRGLEVMEPGHSTSTPTGLGKPDIVGVATPQHANKQRKNSAEHPLLGLPDEEDDDDESFWGSTSSFPALGLNPTEEADEDEGIDKKNRRRRIKKGSRQKMWKAASAAMSPFSLKKGKMNSASTKTLSTDASDSPSPDELKQSTLGFRSSFAGRIDAVTRRNGGSAADLMHSSYQQLDGGDEESVFSSHEEPEPSPKVQPFEPDSESNTFADMLVSAAPLPFDADDNTVSTLGSKETNTRQLLGKSAFL